jgi:hypothetical protein
MKCSQLKIGLLIFGINPCCVSIFFGCDATLFNFKGAFLAILGNNHNQKKCLHSKGLYQKLINQFLTGYTSC